MPRATTWTSRSRICCPASTLQRPAGIGGGSRGPRSNGVVRPAGGYLVHSAVPGRCEYSRVRQKPAEVRQTARRAGDGAPQRAGAVTSFVGAPAGSHGGHRRVPERGGAGEPDRARRRAAGGAGRCAHRGDRRPRRGAGAVTSQVGLSSCRRRCNRGAGELSAQARRGAADQVEGSALPVQSLQRRLRIYDAQSLASVQRLAD